MNQDILGRVSFASFQQHTGSSFSLHQPAETTLRLDKVEMRTPPGSGYECFALIFSGPTPVLPQAIYSLQHSELEELELFLVPMGQQGERVEYECLFNRPCS